MSYTIVKNFILDLPKEAYDHGVGMYLGVVAHATANNGDSADGERNYETTHWKDAFVHFFVDDQKIEQVADYNYVCYGAGHTANHSGYVQIELCQSTDATKFASAYSKYVWLLAYILFQRHLGVTDGVTLMSHAQVSAKWNESNHTDPIAYLASHGKTWANVVADVTAEYKKLEGGTSVTTNTSTINSIGSLVVNTKAGLNLRQASNTTAAVLVVVPYGTTCTVLAVVTGWYEVQYDGKTGWVSSQYVTYTAKPVEKPVPVTPVVVPVVLDYETETIRVMVGGKQVIAVTGITKATEYAKANYPGQTVVLTCASDGKNWTISVPAVVVPVVEVVDPVVEPVAPVAPIVTPDPAISAITDVLTDPANVLVLKQMYVFLNKIFGGR